MLLQAQKRKLGLLEDDDIPKLSEKDEEKGNEDYAGFVKSRGILVKCFRRCPLCGRSFLN